MKFCYSFLLLALFSCSEQKDNKIIVLQPFGNFKSETTQIVQSKIQTINPNVVVFKPIAFPKNSFYKPRNRYRADSIIKFLKHKIGNDTVIVGLTNKDISTTKGNFTDWGVMGLGYHPGKSCMISEFRLAKKNKGEQLYKVILHELGHTEGLPHCKIKTCLMRDAEGGNPLDQEKDFCAKCRNHLLRKGWKLNKAIL